MTNLINDNISTNTLHSDTKNSTSGDCPNRNNCNIECQNHHTNSANKSAIVHHSSQVLSSIQTFYVNLNDKSPNDRLTTLNNGFNLQQSSSTFRSSESNVRMESIVGGPSSTLIIPLTDEPNIDNRSRVTFQSRDGNGLSNTNVLSTVNDSMRNDTLTNDTNEPSNRQYLQQKSMNEPASNNTLNVNKHYSVINTNLHNYNISNKLPYDEHANRINNDRINIVLSYLGQESYIYGRKLTRLLTKSQINARVVFKKKQNNR
ncbi:unnamed protein product [Adineta ricciae]|uniref:Uncharacterized protein n=1 Tax=Adineta ricciae TaxID=249248 RepID=A0A816FB94_ADIRI|nr:unnamed protein product [Adineta ricciae]